MSECGDYEDIFFVINVFLSIAIAIYFLPLRKKITLYAGLVKYFTTYLNLSF